MRQNSDSLLFLRPTDSWRDERDIEERLAAIIGERAETASGREARTGARALLRVPRGAAVRVAELLEERGFSTRAVPAARALTGLPLPFLAMVTGVLVVGSYAGYIALPILAVTSPLFALAMLAYGHRDAQRPVLGGSRANSSSISLGLRARSSPRFRRSRTTCVPLWVSWSRRRVRRRSMWLGSI